MGVPSEIFDNTGGGFECRFTVDDPFFVIASANEIKEMFWVIQMVLRTEEMNALGFQKMKELAPEFTGEDFNWDKELFARVYPRADIS
jgi:hypothetical protein